MIDKEVNNFVAKNFNENIRKEENLTKVAKSIYIFLTTPDKVESSSSDSCVHHYDVQILNILIKNYKCLTLSQWLIIN